MRLDSAHFKKADLEKLQALIEHGMNINWDYNGVSISGLFFIGFRQLDLPNSVDPFSIYCTPYFIPVLLDNNALIDKYFLTAYLKTTPTAVRSKYDKSIQDDFARSDKALLDLDPELFSKFSSLIDKRNQALSNKEEIDTIDSEIQAYVDYLNAKIRERSAKSTK